MTIDSGFNHITVLLDEAVEALAVRADGCYLDGTFGRGGHSRLILSQLGADGKLLGFDKDPQAIATGQALAAEDGRFVVVQRSFAELGAEVAERGMAGKVAGVLLDLGVSSPQLDDPERGFSFMNDGPLDMRMDPTRGVSAAQFIATAPVEEIARVFKEYGEERFAGRMARAVVERPGNPAVRAYRRPGRSAESRQPLPGKRVRTPPPVRSRACAFTSTTNWAIWKRASTPRWKPWKWAGAWW